MTRCFKCACIIEERVKYFAVVTGDIEVPICKRCYEEREE